MKSYKWVRDVEKHEYCLIEKARGIKVGTIFHTHGAPKHKQWLFKLGGAWSVGEKPLRIVCRKIEELNRKTYEEYVGNEV